MAPKEIKFKECIHSAQTVNGVQDNSDLRPAPANPHGVWCVSRRICNLRGRPFPGSNADTGGWNHV